MAEIALTNGGVALVDDDDADVVRQRKWTRVSGGKDKHYAITNINGHTTRLHRELMKPGRGLVVDHINGDGLDNRRANLRVCTQRQNLRNGRKHVRTAANPFKGVYFDAGAWVVRIGGSKSSYIGRFKTAEEAASVYDIAAVLRFGEFACLNFPHVFSEVPSRRKA